jgi:uncharacterized membrane protein YphA (DoxX/SURF4 family)
MEKGFIHIFYLAIRVTIGMAFIYAGIYKMSGLELFAKTIDAFGLVPDFIVYPITIMIPMVEILCGIGFIAGNQESVYVITSMLLMFIAVLIFGISNGIDVDCGCYGPNDSVGESLSNLKISLIRDLIMVSCIFFILFHRRSLQKNCENPRKGDLQ